MANADDIKVTIEVKASDLVEACIKALVEGGTLVEVVRCRECRYYDRSFPHSTYIPDAFYCKYINTHFKEDFYCAYGERRDDGSED